jgi:hypothetical protein
MRSPRCSRPPGHLPSPNSGLLPSLSQSLGGQPPGADASGQEWRLGSRVFRPAHMTPSPAFTMPLAT